MTADPIEGWSIGIESVNLFVEFVYSAMCKVDTADYFAGSFSSVVDRMGEAGATDAELRRYRKTADQATESVALMDAEAVQAASLTPVLLRAAAFDSTLMRMEEQWKAAAQCVGRIDKLWIRLTRSAVPGARRAASLAVDALAERAYWSDQEAHDKDPSEGNRHAGRAMSSDHLDELFNDASSLLATGDVALERRAAVLTRSAKSMLISLVGVLTHVQAQAPAMMTVRPVHRPQRFVRFIALPDGTGLIESVGNAGVEKAEQITPSERKVLLEMGFAPPTRRKHERNWRIGVELSLTGVPVILARVLERVHGLAKGDPLEVVTARLGDDDEWTDQSER